LDLESEQSDGYANDELGSLDEEEMDDMPHPSHHHLVQKEVEMMYAHCYEVSQKVLPCGPTYLHHVLGTLKNCHPDHFCEALCVSPLTFDKLVNWIKNDPVFSNNSNCSQMSVKT
jgi:hypothetical protein